MVDHDPAVHVDDEHGLCSGILRIQRLLRQGVADSLAKLGPFYDNKTKAACYIETSPSSSSSIHIRRNSIAIGFTAPHHHRSSGSRKSSRSSRIRSSLALYAVC